MINIKSCVIQEDKCGCIPACIATILQKTYQEVVGHFKQDFSKGGIWLDSITAYYLAGYGFDIYWLVNKYANDYNLDRKRMLRPFADIHIVSIKNYIDLKSGHAIIMTKNGLLFDPKDGKQTKENFIEVNSVLGLFYPKSWKFKKEKRNRK